MATTFYLTLVDAADPQNFLVDPTIAAGDFQISLAGGAFANLSNLPTVSPSSSPQVQVVLTDAEDGGTIWGSDPDDAWEEVFIDTADSLTNQTALDILEGDHIESATSLVINKKDTTTPVLDKQITGSLYAGTQITTKES